ncbi:MAG: SagB/ThcOx family dehydrogenase [Candidatus Bipolaricaulota bacterium]
MNEFESGRGFLKAVQWQEGARSASDQQRGVPQPAVELPAPDGANVVDLVSPDDLSVGDVPLNQAIRGRRSRRRFTEALLSLEELSFLLWATQGVQKVIRDGYATLRTAPSAGARHPFETYLLVQRVHGLEPGLYRYLSLEHKLCYLRDVPDLSAKVSEACLGQEFVGQAAVVFAWAAVPYRTEWRYAGRSHKVIAIDVGHVCQNLYLACEAIGAGTCAIGAYHQERTDSLLGVDGDEQFAIYLAPVGKLTPADKAR